MKAGVFASLRLLFTPALSNGCQGEGEAGGRGGDCTGALSFSLFGVQHTAPWG